MNKKISKTAVLVAAFAGAGYGIYLHNFWIASLGFIVAALTVYSLECLICKCKDKCDK